MKHQMKRAGAVLAAALALAGCGGGGGSGGVYVSEVAAAPQGPAQAPASVKQRSCTVTFYGDSILNGIDVAPSTLLVNARPKWRVDDRTKPGQSLFLLSTLIANDARSTDYVVVENGVIDSWAGEPVGQRLLDVVRLLQSEGRAVIITGYAHQVVRTDQFAWLTADQVARHDEWDAAAAYVAVQTGSIFANWSTVRFQGQEDIVDAVHPAHDYRIYLTNRLIETLDAVAPECI